MITLELLKKRTRDNWLAGQDSQSFLALTQEFTAANETIKGQSILIAESDPIRFLAGFIAAQATTQRVFLGNPHWGATEWQQALTIVQPDRVWGNCSYFKNNDFQNNAIDRGSWQSPQDQSVPPAERLILIPTGGSSGTVRFVMHRWETLAAAVTGFQQYFQLATVNSICVLPLYHTSGLMQFMRSFLSGGSLWLTPFKALKAGQETPVDPSDWFISLVPTQLQALLEQPSLVQWLARCKTVLIGGAPSWPELLTQARSQHIPLAPCYGMTETAAQIAALKPKQFLAGYQNVGQVLPHAQVTIVDDRGQPVAPGTIGQVQIAADSLALGYYPSGWSNSCSIENQGNANFKTDDAGYLDDQGYLTLVGRLSNKIITGGENVFPAEVESAIWATHLVADVAVLGMPDPYWGQCVTAVYAPRLSTLSSQDICAALQDKIARFKQPKVWVPVESLPRNAQGKLNRQTLQAIAIQWIQEHGV